MKRTLTLLGTALALTCGTATADDVETKYKPGKGLTWQTLDGDHALGIGGRVQLRYTYEDFDDEAEEDVSNFAAQRVRIFAKGHVYRDWKYKFQADFGKGKSSLKDASLTYARVDQAQFTVGQFKTRFDWQQYTSSGKQMFADRSLAAGKLGIGRDVGAMLHGDIAGGKFEYNVGVFDGEGEGESGNENDGHLYVARVSFQPMGPFGYSESDIARTDDHLWFFNFAAALEEGEQGAIEIADKDYDTNVDKESYTVGVGYRHGGLHVQGEYYWHEADFDSAENEFTTIERGMDGWYLQVGHVFPGSAWELAGRYSEWDPDDDVDHDAVSESMIGVTKYFEDLGHSLKIDADVALIEEEDPDGTDTIEDLRVRLQFQIVF